MGKPRLKKTLSSEELERLTTPRLLAYKKRLHSCPEEASYDEREPGVTTHYGLYKSHPEWRAGMNRVLAVLKSRENVDD